MSFQKKNIILQKIGCLKNLPLSQKQNKGSKISSVKLTLKYERNNVEKKHEKHRKKFK